MQIELAPAEVKLIQAALQHFHDTAYETLTYMQAPNARDRNGDRPKKRTIDAAIDAIARTTELQERFV